MSDPFRERLRRLRREGEGAAPITNAPITNAPVGDGTAESVERTHARPQPAGMPAWLRSRLGRAGHERGAGSLGSPAPRAALTVGEPRALELHEGPGGPFSARVTRFPDAHVHGEWALAEVDHVADEDLVLLAGDEELRGLALRDVVYLDIETTGLSGGAGVFPFLIALGTFDADGFEMWQGFLRSPADEPALLAECARRIAGKRGVVSFFGKSFDRHRLEDKMRVCGVEPPFAGTPHLDLYHPLAALYRAAWPDTRLARAERELCGVQRKDDLSGAFAPEAWFDFLGDRGHRLEAVFQHNLDDVLSLVTLAAHLGRVPVEQRSDGAALPGPAHTRASGIARALERAGDRERALTWVERALERHTRDEARPLLSWRADLLRLLGRNAEALEAYRTLVDDPRSPDDGWTVRALLQSAKLLEHKQRDLEAALRECRRASALIESRLEGRLAWRDHARLAADCAPRLARLERKLQPPA